MSLTAKTTTAEIEGITPYQVINLLLDGALERVDQAIYRINEGDSEEAAVLVQKTIGIVNGLRQSLNLDEGGTIATNLDALYEYIASRLDSIKADDEPITVLNEVRKLLSEVHQGWVGIADQV